MKTQNIKINKFKIYWLSHPDFNEVGNTLNCHTAEINAKTKDEALEKWTQHLKGNRSPLSFERNSKDGFLKELEALQETIHKKRREYQQEKLSMLKTA